MERSEFIRLVRDCLANLYDRAALETHPLTALFPKPPAEPGSQGEFLRRQVLQAVERLRPAEPEPSACPGASIAWRPYVILHGRYVEGLGLRELQARLSLSERQLRREHSRALRAVAALLANQAEPVATETEAQEAGPPQGEPTPWDGSLDGYQLVREPLDVAEVARGVAATLERRVQREGTELRLLLGPHLPRVLADRVLLRQILFSLFRCALDMRVEGRVALRSQVQPGSVSLWVEFQTEQALLDNLAASEQSPLLQAARLCAQRIEGALDGPRPTPEASGTTRLILTLPRADRSVVLVVDDQPPALQMFRRFLSQTPIQVVGVQDPAQVLPLARQIRPQAITLDIMMPTMDGWEILQALGADPETRHIPVIVCSVWDEPELAFSLGAAHFLRKPITQEDLLQALAQLGVWESADGSSRAGTSAPRSARGARAGGAS